MPYYGYRDIEKKFVFGSINKTELELHLHNDIQKMYGQMSTQCQSRWIALSATMDIYDAMDFMLSPFCTSFDEFAVAMLLKQLSKDKGGVNWMIIKAIWKMFSDDKDMQLHGIKVSREFHKLSTQTLSID